MALSSQSYNNPAKRSHPPPSPSAFFASAHAARSSSAVRIPSPLSSASSISYSPSPEPQQVPPPNTNLPQIAPRPANGRTTSVCSTSSSSSTASSSSGVTSPSASPSPRNFSPASLSNQQTVVDSYRNRYAAYLAASWGMSPEAASQEFEHQLHTRPAMVEVLIAAGVFVVTLLSADFAIENNKAKRSVDYAREVSEVQ